VTNNEILKKLRIALNLKDTDIIEILKLADFDISKSELSALFRSEDQRNYRECGDQILRRFLNGLIIRNRGKKTGRYESNHPTPAPLPRGDFRDND
jgi:uncharacterized protein YehS (DUF1456 family)